MFCFLNYQSFCSIGRFVRVTSSQTVLGCCHGYVACDWDMVRMDWRDANYSKASRHLSGKYGMTAPKCLSDLTDNANC